MVQAVQMCNKATGLPRSASLNPVPPSRSAGSRGGRQMCVVAPPVAPCRADRTLPVTSHSTGLCQKHVNACEGMESFETAVNKGIPLKFRLYLDTVTLSVQRQKRMCN